MTELVLPNDTNTLNNLMGGRLMHWMDIVSAISAPELTGVTNTLQSTTFRAFEFYFVATGLYLLMAIAVRLALDGIQWLVFVRGRAW